MAFGLGFNTNSGPRERGGSSQQQFQSGNFPPLPISSSPSPRLTPPLFTFNNNNNSPSPPRPIVSPPTWGPGPKPFSDNSNFQIRQGPSAVAPYLAPSNASTSIPARPANFQDLKRTRSPPSANKVFSENYTQNVSGRPKLSPSGWGADQKSIFGDPNTQTHQGPSSVAPYAANFQDPRRTTSPPSANKVPFDNYRQDVSGRGLGATERMRSPPQAYNSNHNVEDLRHPSGTTHRWPNQSSNFQASKKVRSPPVQSANEIIWRNSHPAQGDTDRAFVNPSRFGDTSTLLNSSYSSIQQRSSPFSPDNEAEGVGSKTMNSQVSKRNRSPSLAFAEEHLPGTSYSPEDDNEREMQAKAKRLARFGVELSQPVQGNPDHIKHKSPTNRHAQALERRIADQPIEAVGDFMLSDYESLESSGVIAGLCPDMCPESEKAERERKGDLDKYERLDGDRNQTSKSLAVKKYNRTAEREADLIRPMPVLQQTIDYLLGLLDQPYDDKFLGMYNFLWDRMRAIRMDLRMQHIFNQDAISMLEQMIRFHIIAMHELCEYTKGEGFSEGFDAHLNIEQMNKTSVELFQMYDDHRKKGSVMASEKEFRGYYALLKLDKHPGYKVEPAELSLDLAKMTPEIRHTSEILFARDVARACRTGNYIAFFRLARKATYLQSCLMHAHFAKLRTQALASLHSGLLNGQGIPISHVIKWLGMEEEDIEDVLEYHGFLIKEFEESYMVKEGPFLSSDKDYPTKCSRLVHLKKSRRIFEDVSSSNQSMWPTVESKQIVSDKIVRPDSKAIQSVKNKASVDAVDEVMHILEEDPALTKGSQAQPMLEILLTDQRVRSYHQVAAAWDVPSPQHSPQSALAVVGKTRKPALQTLRNDSLDRTLRSSAHDFTLKSVTERAQQSERSEGPSFGSWVENSATQMVISPQENVETLVTQQEVEDEEFKTHNHALEDEQAMIHNHELEDEEAVTHNHESENEEDTVTVYQNNEVAMAKLKLILRKWKRLSSKRKELMEQRRLAANAALSSLTLGPPIQQIRAPRSHVRELDIDGAVRERHGRHQKSWSRLNTSEVVGRILSGRNPEAKCLCWKLIICSQSNDTEGDRSVLTSQTNHLASNWLHHKLMGVKKDNEDELIASSLDFSIWKKWVTHQYDSSPICCLSVIREANIVGDTVGGAGAILFLVAESIPLDVQKTQLHNLLTSLPSGSCVPLLILCSTQKGGSLNPLMIRNGLGLQDVDKARISSFSVSYLVEDQSPEHLDAFFSTDCLREGLQWLASQSPIQPVVHCIKTRNLVMDHLNSSLGVLENMNVSVVGPNLCISAFNEALDRSATEIAMAADTNPTSWPCLEITLLESSNEHIESFLPRVGWSSAATIKPILSRIQDCKLPFFPDDLSWLNNGSVMGEEILHHKSELERCLVRYLTDSSKMLNKALAITEASVILQKGALLELQGSKYCIKAKWVAIFRRIFNWHLMNLSGGADCMAYVLEHRSNLAIPLQFGVEEFTVGAASSALHGSDNVGLEVYGSPHSLTQLSLDEMVGVFCSTSQFGREQSIPEVIEPLSKTVNHGKEALHATTFTDNMEDEENPQQEIVSTKTNDGNLSRRMISDDCLSREVVLANKGNKEAHKLSKLLEQCNIVQNKIDEKLFIYF